MIKKVIDYIKAYNEPDYKMVRSLAFESAKTYYKNKQKTAVEFQSYQRGYVSAYRSKYAKTKLDSMKGV
jgi:hypothetical protein